MARLADRAIVYARNRQLGINLIRAINKLYHETVGLITMIFYLLTLGNAAW